MFLLTSSKCISTRDYVQNSSLKLHLLIEGEREKTCLSFVIADVFYGVSVKKAERELVRCLCFPHLFIFRGGKKKGKS